MKRSLFGGLVAAIASISVAVTATADPIADTYRGRTVTILFGYSVGGTYGQYSLLISEFLSKHIPGNPNVITQSMPGAGGLKATNYAYNVLPKDGLGLFMPPDSLIVSQLLRPDAARYEADGFTWLGNVVESNSVIVVTRRSGIRTFEDAMKREVVMSSTGTGSQTFLIPKMLNGVFDTKFKIIMGYKGSQGSTHAMELGEVHGVSLTWLTLIKNRANWFDDSPHPTKAIPIVQVGFRKEADLKDVPLASEIAKTKEDRQIVNFVASLGPIGRGLVVPPGVSKDLIVALRKAFDGMIKDPAFIAAANKRGLRVEPKTGAEVQQIVSEVLEISPDVVARARKAILGG
ncbi:MAG TPA: hypothetical protein VGA77_02065 [Propylenella sp.]|jgi:tripartite-type tricarboxylate transporter receptor subunit TctC